MSSNPSWPSVILELDSQGARLRVLTWFLDSSICDGDCGGSRVLSLPTPHPLHLCLFLRWSFKQTPICKQSRQLTVTHLE